MIGTGGIPVCKKTMMTQKKISVVIACYNESANIIPMHNRLTDVLRKITSSYEIIFVDNASIDGSEEIFRELAKKDKKISVLFMSRNFGTSQPSFTAGSEYASGDAVIWIEGDLQDPPELIEEFVEKWLDGFDVIYGVKIKRGERSIIKRFGYRFFYHLFRKLSYIDIPEGAGDFSLLDRKVLDVLNSMPERDRFLRGLRAWVGFKNIGIPYERKERAAGRSAYTIFRYIYWARKMIFAFSFVPLSLISYMAFITVVVAFIAAALYVFFSIFYPAPRGFLTIFIAMLFIGGIQLLCLSIIGEYLAKIFEEVKARPKYVIREILNDTGKNGEQHHSRF